MSISAQIFLNEPVYWEQNIKIYAPLVKEVIGNPKYNEYANLLTICQEDIWDMIVKDKDLQMGTAIPDAPTPFEYLLANCYNNPQIMKDAEEAFYFFTHEKVKIIPSTRIIIFTDGIDKIKDAKDIRNIQEENYFNFQNKLREVLGEEKKEPPKLNENPKVAYIKAKARYREKLKKKKGNKNSISLGTMLTALCCSGIGLNPLNIGEITFPAMNEIFKVFQQKEKYETDLRVATAGFGNKKVKPKYWINPN